MKYFVGVTDSSWFESLGNLKPNEVSPWHLSGKLFRAIEVDAPFPFKLDSPDRTVPDELYVDGVAMVDEMRGNSIGSRLSDLLERIALERGIRTISVEVINTNPRAKTLYERLAFVVTKQRRVWPFRLVCRPPFQSAIEMVKTIG